MRSTKIVLALTCLVLQGLPLFADDPTRASVVRIETLSRATDVLHPWKKLAPQSSAGTGIVIEGKRILTNAHVVRDGIDIFVQPDRSSEKLVASVEAISPAVDLAVLKLDDEAFFNDHRPLERSREASQVQDAVVVYGYPRHGIDLSVTRGIVSRIDFVENWQNASSEMLRLQVDAALNPGNSGGPVLAGGKMIGVAFAGVDSAENVGYVIPVEEIELFLTDVADGRYDGKAVLLDVTRHLENTALRSKLEVGKATTGVLVAAAGGPEATYPIRTGDIITRIGDYPIDNSAMVRAEGNRYVNFHYLVQKLARDNMLTLTILRDGREQEVTVPVGPERNAWLCPQPTGAPDEYGYFVYGPLVFTEATRQQLNELHRNYYTYLANRRSPLIVRYGDRPAFDGERLVYVIDTFPHRLIQGYTAPSNKAVNEVNGVAVKNLRHLVEIVRDTTDPFVEFSFAGSHPDRIVFRRDEVARAMEAILEHNNIRQQASSKLMPVWQAARAN